MEQTLEAPPAVAAEAPGFWLRGGALVLDNFLVSAASALAGALLALVGLPQLLRLLVNVVLAAGYFTWWPMAHHGQTLGKKAAGLAIVRRDGADLTYGSLFLRWLGYLASAFTLGFGYVMAVFTDRRRALQDYIGGTCVVVDAPVSKGRKAAIVFAGLLIPLAAIVGLVAALAIPRFASMQSLAQEAAARASLSQLRVAEKLYEGDNNGAFPKDLAALSPKYLPQTPPLLLGQVHPRTAAVTVYGAEACSGSKADGQRILGTALKDTGGWGLVVAAGAPCDGDVFIDCTHASGEGQEWFRY